MTLAKDYDVVEALAPDRADEPFNIAVLPGRAGCDGPVADSHDAESLTDDVSIDAIMIAEQVAWCLYAENRLGANAQRFRVGQSKSFRAASAT